MVKVSVILPAYNCENYIKYAIQSIITQSFKDWELLISDDGSIDQTKLIIDNFDDPRIKRFHNEKNLGVIKTKNKLLKKANGEYILWQDADDESKPDRIRNLLLAFKKDPDLMLCGSNFERKYKFWNLKYISNFPTEYEEIVSSIDNKKSPFLGAVPMIKKSAIEYVGGFRDFFESTGWEDHDLILRISEKFKVGNIPDVLYIYRYTRKSISRNISSNNILKLYSPQIGFYLAYERKNNNGNDSLSDNMDQREFNNFLESLRKTYVKDKSIIYRRNCITKKDNKDYFFAFKDVILAIYYNPRKFSNYELPFRILYNLIVTIILAIRTNSWIIKKKISDISN